METDVFKLLNSLLSTKVNSFTIILITRDVTWTNLTVAIKNKAKQPYGLGVFNDSLKTLWVECCKVQIWWSTHILKKHIVKKY